MDVSFSLLSKWLPAVTFSALATFLVFADLVTLKEELLFIKKFVLDVKVRNTILNEDYLENFFALVLQNLLRNNL